MNPETHAGFLDLQSAKRPGSAAGQFCTNGLSKSVFNLCFFVNIYIFVSVYKCVYITKAEFKWVLWERIKKILLKESQRQSRRHSCLHNNLTEHWDFQKNLHALATHFLLLN